MIQPNTHPFILTLPIISLNQTWAETTHFEAEKARLWYGVKLFYWVNTLVSSLSIALNLIAKNLIQYTHCGLQRF